MKKGLIAVAVLGLVGCGPPPDPQYPPPGGGGGATSGQRPSWIDSGRAAGFPEMQYMIGVGHGQERMPCENDARAAIAKIFKANISQVSNDWQGHFSRVNNSGAAVRVEAMSVDQLTRVSTDYTLKGVEIKQVWNDPADRSAHCLAVLDRVGAAQTLCQRIAMLDAQIRTEVKEGDNAAGQTTAQFMHYKKAMEQLQERQALAADLRIVSSHRSCGDSRVDWDMVVSKFTRARSAIKIGFHLKGSERAKVQSCLGEELNKQGIRVLEGSSDVDLWIHGKIDMKKAGTNLGSQMVRATINMRITSADDSRTIAAFTRDVKAGRPRLAQSIQLAASKLCQDVAPKLAQEIQAALSR